MLKFCSFIFGKVDAVRILQCIDHSINGAADQRVPVNAFHVVGFKILHDFVDQIRIRRSLRTIRRMGCR
ncbi:hypothetical protein D3C80_2109880 [compost metagenome]